MGVQQSFTKLYLHDAAVSLAGTLPGVGSVSGISPTQSATGAATNRSMDTALGALQTNSAAVTMATQSTSNQTQWHRRFVSDVRLAPQAIAAATWTLQCGCAESNANSNMVMFFRVYLWSTSTGASAATLLAASSDSAEPGTTETNTSTTGAGSSAAAGGGEVLVVEVWSQGTQGKASAYTRTGCYYDGTVEASATDNAAFLSFANPIAVMQPRVEAIHFADPALA